MAVPTPDFTSNDLSDSGVWTELGSAFSNAIADRQATTGIDFDAVNDGVYRSALFTNQTTISLAFSFKIPDTATQKCIVGQDNQSTGNYQFFVRTENTGKLSFWLMDGTATNYVIEQTTAGDWDDDEWHDVVVTGNLNTLKIFIDGAKVASGTTIQGTGFAGFGGTSQNFKVGQRGNGSNQAEGIIARVNAWFVELTEAQALEHIANEVAAIPSGDNPNDLGGVSSRVSAPIYPTNGVFNQIYKV